MPSKAIASLDAWLVRAEEVLAEQREHAISPSLGLLKGDGHYAWTTTLAALSQGLEGLLESLCRRPGRWILIIEDERRRHLFWQALAYEDGSLCCEVVSNQYLTDEQHWSREQEARLLALGWEPPRLPGRPNYITVETTTSPDSGSECRRAIATLRELFGLDDDDKILVKLFSSTIRGDTPASPHYSTEEDASPIPEHAATDEIDYVCQYPAAPEAQGTVSGPNAISEEQRRPDARHCPTCGAMGILPLNQQRGPNGEIHNPVMICPVCDQEFTADGMIFQSFGAPPIDLTGEDFEEWAEDVVSRIGDGRASTRC